MPDNGRSGRQASSTLTTRYHRIRRPASLFSILATCHIWYSLPHESALSFYYDLLFVLDVETSYPVVVRTRRSLH